MSFTTDTILGLTETFSVSVSTESANPVWTPYTTKTEKHLTTTLYRPQTTLVGVLLTLLPSSPKNTSISLFTPKLPTTSPSPSPATNTTGGSNLGKNTVSKDTFAGVSVACVIGGALLAALLTYFVMSHRHKKRSSGYKGGFAGERHRTSRASNEKALPIAPVALGGVAGNWEKHLDQPESDGTITRRVKGLFDHIEVHVENFYRDTPVNITPELQAALMRVDSRDLPDSVVGLLPQTERPTMLIKHCIAHSIVEHISSESDVQDSFLPVDFVALPQALTTRRTAASKPAYNQAYSRWRVLSSYLRPKPAEDATYTTTRDTHITALADAICHAFDPWAMSRDNFTSRRDNMINIMKSASETGVLLFSQPSTLKWRWSVPESKSGRLRIVLLPGLEKTRDENANELQRPLELLRPVTGVVIG